MFDKLLILLLIISFPVAAYVTHEYLLADPVEDPAKTAAIQKLDTLIAELKNYENKSPNSSDQPQINLTTVFYASDSGKLTVTGQAPSKDLQLLASFVPKSKPKIKDVTLKKQATDSASTDTGSTTDKDTDVLGEAVEVRAIPVGSDGTFTFNYPVESKNYQSIEIRLDQANSSKTVIYDFERSTFNQI